MDAVHRLTRGWVALVFCGAVCVGVVADPAAAAPTPVPPQPAAFPPGVWRGLGVVTGAIDASGEAAAFINAPIKVHFEVEIAPDGAVVNGVWDWAGEISSAAESVEGTFTMTASGSLGGSGARIELSGLIHMTGSVTVQGNIYPVETDMPAAGAFSPTSASCNVVSGDLATEGRAAQQAAGIGTTVTGPFTARRIAAPGDDPVASFEDVYTELVMTAEGLLATGQPPAEDVVAFVERTEDFFNTLYASVSCPGGNPSLLPGSQRFAYFAQLLGQVLTTALADPSVYSASDVHALAIAAVRLGVIGTSAADPVLAEQVRVALVDALTAKLADAQATDNKGDCAIVAMAALAIGDGELAAQGQACAS